MELEEIARLNEGRGLGHTLGIELVEATPDRVVMRMEVGERVQQPFGFLHGGASVALAETVASVGGLLGCPPGKAVFGQEINANHLRPKQGGALVATGWPLHRGRTTQVWQIEIAGEDGKLVCVSRCTLAVVDARQ